MLFAQVKGWSTSWHHRLGISPGTGISASLSAETIEPVVDDSLDSGDAVSDRERVLGDVLSSRDSLSGSGEFLAVLVYDGDSDYVTLPVDGVAVLGEGV